MSDASFVPLSAAELREAVRNAQRYDPHRLSRILGVDERAGLIEVQAHTTWGSVVDRLRPGDAQAARARTRTTMTTVADSIAANAAGPDGRPSVVHVDAITVIAPDGDMRRVSRHANRDLFSLIVGGHGLFGTIYSITLRVDAMARAVAQQVEPQAMGVQADARGPVLRLLVPPERLTSCLEQLHARCEEWRIEPQRLELRPILKEEDETFLSWAPREYMEVGIRLGAPASISEAVRTTQAARDLIDAAIDHGGSFPIASTPQASLVQAEACYPRLREFLAEKRRIDPGQRLTNPWYRHYCALMLGRAIEARWSR